MNTSRLILYSAVTLDGFVAGPQGELDWLKDDTDEDYGYFAFLETIDITLMGRKTYEMIKGFGVDWPYPNTRNLVFSRSNPDPGDPNVEWVHGLAEPVVAELKALPEKNIWLIGGGGLNAALLEQGLIDELRLFVHPTVLSKGIPLFDGAEKRHEWETELVQAYESGVTEIRLTLPGK